MSIWNNTTLARRCRASLAGLVLVIVPAALAKAEYGPRTVFGTNYQQTSTTTSTNGINEGDCINTSACFVLFQPAPAQKKLIVQHASCRVTVSTGSLLHGQIATRIAGTFPLRFTYFTPVNIAGGSWAVNNPAMHLVESGARLRLAFSASANANWNAICNVSGQLEQP